MNFCHALMDLYHEKLFLMEVLEQYLHDRLHGEGVCVSRLSTEVDTQHIVDLYCDN